MVAKQGNAGERPNAVAEYTVKSSEDNSLLFILHRYSLADKPREFEVVSHGRGTSLCDGLSDRGVDLQTRAPEYC